MAVSPLELDFGISGPALGAHLPPSSATRHMPGNKFQSGGVEALSHSQRKVWSGNSQAYCREEGVAPELVQVSLWQDLFSAPADWWDNRRSKLTARHPDFKHKQSKAGLWLNSRYKPAWVDSHLATWGGGMVRPPEYVSTPVQGPGAFASSHEAHLKVELCKKLCDDGRTTEAVDELQLLVQQRCRVDNNLFYRVLKRCTGDKDLVLGRRIHALTIQSGYEGDSFLATHLIGLYASLGRLEEAMRIFTRVPTPDAHLWATIIFACARHGEASQAVRLYQQMRESTVKQPDNRIYVAVLKACATAGDLVAGKEVHAHILASPGKPDIFVQTGLLVMYAKCGSLEDARGVFDGLPQRDVVTWNAMIAGYALQGMGQDALNLYSSMQQEGLSLDSHTFVCLLQACANVGSGALHQGKQLHEHVKERRLQHHVLIGCSLVNMYAKCGSLRDARNVFDTLPVRDVVTWTAMIAGYVQQGMAQEGLSLYSSMQQQGLTPPDSCTFVCLLQACAMVVDLPLGKQLHAQIVERGMQADVVVGVALVNMYAKCGSMSDSQQVFDSLLERTIEAWSALIGGYTRQGNCEAVFALLDRMRLEGVQPNGITFLNVLTVCSHVGLVDKGRNYFEAMRSYGITPTVEHYTCMIDLLGRAGHLDEALQMAKTMPCPRNNAVWHTLLGACQKWKNVVIGQEAFEFAVSVDVKDDSSYVLMSNIYASSQMGEAAQEMQARRLKSGAWKKPGQSWWTDIDGAVHTFAVGDGKPPKSGGIYANSLQSEERRIC